MKYIKKPIPIEAFCPEEDEWPDWFTMDPYILIEKGPKGYFITIPTLEGDMNCTGKDYIIKGVDGELYPCRRDIFLKTYEFYQE